MKDTHKLKVKGCQIYFMQIEMKLKAQVATLISVKIGFKTKAI